MSEVHFLTEIPMHRPGIKAKRGEKKKSVHIDADESEFGMPPPIPPI